MRLFDSLSETSKLAMIDRYAGYGLKYLDDNPGCTDSAEDIAVDYGRWGTEMTASDFSGINWTTHPPFGGPLPPRPPKP